MPQKPKLISLPFSPWSEKAKWALDARRIDYDVERFQPLLGEPALRMKLGKWTGNVTVPVLVDEEGKAMMDSAAIARWADSRGDGATLFPKGKENETTRFVELSERALDAGRALSLQRMLDDDDALLEMVPKPMRNMRAIGTRVGAMGIVRTLKKYGSRGRDRDSARAALRAELDELRRTLVDKGAKATLLDSFSFADIAAAQALAFVHPPSKGLRIGDASRRSFHDDVLAEEYKDLLDWRDALYETHR